MKFDYRIISLILVLMVLFVSIASFEGNQLQTVGLIIFMLGLAWFINIKALEKEQKETIDELINYIEEGMGVSPPITPKKESFDTNFSKKFVEG